MKNSVKNILSIALTFSALAAHADSATWKDKCTDLKTCIDAYSALTGQEYIYENGLSKISIQMTDNIPFVKDDADLIFTNILYQNGMARVTIKPNVYNIMRLNDAKSKDVPLILCSQKTAPQLPNTYDLVTLEYKFTNGNVAKDAENVIRTFTDMGARIYGMELAGTLLITDVAKHMSKTYEVLKTLDVKPTAEFLANRKAWDAARRKELENGGGHKPTPPTETKKDSK